MTRPITQSWRLPPTSVLTTAVLLIALAEVGGASMVRYRVEVTRWVREVMQARPTVHGLVGVRDVDETILDEAVFKVDAALRLFHMHAEGMGLVVLATSAVATTVVAAAGPRRILLALLTVGGAGYPLGYLAWGVLIPHYGLEAGKAWAERLLWIPFGGASLLGLWWLTAILAWRLVRP
jgi:hypothetical protein